MLMAPLTLLLLFKDLHCLERQLLPLMSSLSLHERATLFFPLVNIHIGFFFFFSAHMYILGPEVNFWQTV